MHLLSLSASVIVLTYSVKFISSVSLRLLDTSCPKVLFLRMSSANMLRSEGIFERFLRNYLHLLAKGLTGKQLKIYCKMLSEELEKLEFTYTKNLAKHLRCLSRKNPDDLVDEMENYHREFEEKLPHRQNFLRAMNEVFTLQQNLRFEDYNHDLLEYANGIKLFIQEETRKLLNDVIVNNIHKISKRDKKYLEKELRLAIKEYKDDDY